MKKNLIRVIATILVLAGSGTVIHNRTDDDIKVNDSTIVSNPLQKHAFKEYIERSIDVPLNIDIHHTATDTLTGIDQINKFIIDERGWANIPYHFAIDYKGEYYFLNNPVMRTYHNSKDNTKGIGIAMIGNFSEYRANDEMLCRLEVLVKALDSVLDIKSINGHRDWKATQCPGDSLYPQLNERHILKNNNR